MDENKKLSGAQKKQELKKGYPVGTGPRAVKHTGGRGKPRAT